ncbi:retrovirus-related pol polyprotein from transposon TNT 1-94 [Tanacetum coccineum]
MVFHNYSTNDDEGAEGYFPNLETVVECLVLFPHQGFTPLILKNCYQLQNGSIENKKDERGVVVRNKARLVAQGHRQEEGIDYDEVFAPVARLEAIRIFLAFASYMGFIVYQIDVKSAFLYGKIDEDVMCLNHQVFLDPKYPSESIQSCKISLLATSISQCLMSSMGELTFFLGLQVKQKEDGIFISQDKIEEAICGCPSLYVHEWASLMYLTASIPDIMFGSLCLYLEKSTTGVSIFFGKRLILVNANCRTIVATSLQKQSLLLLQAVVGKGLIEFRESLRRVSNGTEALLIPTLFILWLDKQRFPRKSFSKKHRVHKESVSKQRRKFAKGESSVQRDPLFDEIPEDTVDHMETKNAQNEGRTREMVDEDKEIDENILSTEDVLSTDKEGVSTDMEKVSTDRPIVSTDGSKVSTDRHIEGTEEEIAAQATQTSTQTPTSKIFGDDETIAKVLLNMSQAKAVSREKEKGVELKDVEETDRPKPTSTRSLLTLSHFQRLNPKDKGKKKLKRRMNLKVNLMIDFLLRSFKNKKESNLTKKKEQSCPSLAQLPRCSKKIPCSTEDHKAIFLAQQRSEAIRNKPPTKNQLRNQMMTYLKHVGNYKHAELKIKKFEEVQALYEKIKRSDEDFISIGSAEDERLIKKMNEKGVDLSKSEVIKEESKEEVQEEDKDEESTRKRKLGTRKKMKSRKRRYIQNTSEDDSDKENDELRLYLTIAQDEEKEVDYEILDRKYPIKEWKTECLGAKPQTDQAEHLEEINLNVVIRSNGQKRYFSTLMTVLSIFDREDLNAVYQLVMEKYQDEMPEGFDKVLWGDLMVMFNPDDENEFWNAQQDWKIVSWKLHGSSGVHVLVTDTGLVIHMLVEKKYPLRKEVLKQMLKLKLESEEESTMALELIKFVKKILTELESEEHKNWLVHKQTAYGKDFSNPFMVDNLPKILRFSIHLASVVKSWLVHDQTVHDVAEKTKLLLKKDRVYKFKKCNYYSLYCAEKRLLELLRRTNVVHCRRIEFKDQENDKSVWIHPLRV